MMTRRISNWASLDGAILRCAALLVPPAKRSDWLTEWRSELWYVLERCRHEGRRPVWDRNGILFCLGSFRDAAWVRCNDQSPDSSRHPWLRSPIRCLMVLTTLASVAAVFFFRSSGPLDTLLRASRGHREALFAHLLMIFVACVVLPATTSLALGEYPANPYSPARARRVRRWIFLGIKLSLIVMIVFCGTLDLAQIAGVPALQPHVALLGYILAFRWALIDQRRRCPVCLRLLANPVRIGRAGQTILEWSGTELVCTKGHGLLHLPEIATTYSAQRWLDLDASWSSLFLS
jgi:hypothetical protein